MDAEYLKEHIGDVLASGLTSVFVSEPVDPVDYLARWLLNYVDIADKEAESAALEQKLKAQDAVIESEAIMKAERLAKDAKFVEDEAAKNIADFEDYLTNASSMTGLLENFSKHLQKVTKASAVYIGKKEEGTGEAAPVDEDADEGDDEPASKEIIKYVATTEGHEFMLDNKLLGNMGVTHRVFKEDEAKEDDDDAGEDEDEDEDGEPKAPTEVVEKEDKSVFVPNVLLGSDAEKMHFWQLPNLGSYFAMHLPYEACLNENTLEMSIEKEAEILEQKKAAEEEAAEAAAAAAAEAAEDGEEEAEEATEPGEDAEAGEGDEAEPAEGDAKEEEPAESEEERLAREAAEAKAIAEANEAYLISMLPKEKIDYVVCLDTLNNARMTDEQVALTKRFIKLFKETLLRLDRALFKKERMKRATFAELEESYDEPSTDDVEAEKQKLVIALEKQGLPVTEADVQYKYRTEIIFSLKMMIAEFKTYNVFRGPLRVIQALFYMLDYTKQDIADVDGKPVWAKMRSKFSDELFHKIQNYDPRAEQKRGKGQKYATIAALKKLLEGLDVEDVKKRNFALGEIFGLVTDALAVKTQAKHERIAAKKAAAEAEAAARAELEALEAAEAAEGDAPEEDDEDE